MRLPRPDRFGGQESESLRKPVIQEAGMKYTTRRILIGAYALFAGFVPLAGNQMFSVSSAANPPQNTPGDRPGNGFNTSSIASGRFSKILVIRLKKGDDLLEGLRRAVAQEKVKNGALLGAFGSLTSYHVHVVNNTTFPPKNIYMKGKGPYDILSVTGVVIDGRLHPHLTLADSKKAMGGHLEEGSLVFTFAVVTLGVFEEGISLDKFDDWNWN
jgi:predicted DNA-binding protein with PD1-like motif